MSNNIKPYNYWIINIAKQTSIQISDSDFVSPNVINFDITKIDKVLETITNNKPKQILAIHSFINFPIIPNYTWNHYILMSYCTQISKKFNVICPGPNNKNIGILYSRQIKNPNYFNFAAQIIMENNIDLNINCVTNFILENGLLAQRKMDTINTIFETLKRLWKV